MAGYLRNSRRPKGKRNCYDFDWSGDRDSRFGVGGAVFPLLPDPQSCRVLYASATVRVIFLRQRNTKRKYGSVNKNFACRASLFGSSSDWNRGCGVTGKRELAIFALLIFWTIPSRDREGARGAVTLWPDFPYLSTTVCTILAIIRRLP